MDESLPSQPNPSRRGQGRDNDILVPRTEIEVGSEDEGIRPGPRDRVWGRDPLR